MSETENKAPESDLRPGLQAVIDAQSAKLDAARKVAVDKQHARGRCTAREGVAQLLDEGSFVEYGGLAKPATKGMQGAADGLVMGTGKVDGRPVVIVAYDYTVYAGTQSAVNHGKISRMFQYAERQKLPVLCWLDGGGARPHDMFVQSMGTSTTFVTFSRISGLAPTVGIVPGRAFAGHANLAGLSDCAIATKNASMGMAGPPLVEAALGMKLTPEEIGPAEVHMKAGSIDLVAEDDADACRLARKYLSYFSGPVEPKPAPDPEKLRDLVPESPRRAYDVRKVIEGIADADSMLELKPAWGRAMVTALARIEGRTVGVVANQPMFLGGAMDSPACAKSARFVELCDAYDIPLLLLCDTPGLMVGPEIEKTALVRHSARLLSVLANATVPMMTVVLRKAYGLGYYIMGSRPLHPAILLAWPTAEFGGMGLEGAASIIYKPELDAIADTAERAEAHKAYTAELKAFNTSLRVGERFGFDDVIDPADTRQILASTMDTFPAPAPRTGKKLTISPI